MPPWPLAVSAPGSRPSMRDLKVSSMSAPAQNASATDLDQVQRRESEMLRACWKSPEHAEAVQAFLEKRAPRFR